MTGAAAPLEMLFRHAVAAIDAGDLNALEKLLAAHPELVRERLRHPGERLQSTSGGALRGFFKKPYLLWFVAEDPVRNGTLPANIVAIARAIIEAARREQVKTLPEQLDYTLLLVSWSWIAEQCHVQIPLIDLLVDAGASPEGKPDNSLVNGHCDAAAHLVARGATLTLSTAMCLERWADVTRLAVQASARDKQLAFILSALNGKAEAVRRILAFGVEIDKPARKLYAHATALHHAVSAGSLETVKVLVEAGASLTRKDTAWHATARGWAEYYVSENENVEKREKYGEIAGYLRARMEE